MNRAPEGQPASLIVRPRPVLQVMLAVLAALAGAHLIFVVVLPRILGMHREFGGLHRFFHMGREANLPTYWSALVLLTAGILLLLIAGDARRAARPYVAHWFVLGCGFVYLSFDEAAQIHEGVIAMMWLHFFERGEGIWYYVWYVPMIPVLLVLLIAYTRFLRHLPLRYMVQFLFAAGLFLGGAVGMDMVEAQLDYTGRTNWIDVSQLIEESMEIAGVTVFIHALLSYLAGIRASYLIRAEPDVARTPAPSR